MKKTIAILILLALAIILISSSIYGVFYSKDEFTKTISLIGLFCLFTAGGMALIRWCLIQIWN